MAHCARASHSFVFVRTRDRFVVPPAEAAFAGYVPTRVIAPHSRVFTVFAGVLPVIATKCCFYGAAFTAVLPSDNSGVRPETFRTLDINKVKTGSYFLRQTSNM